MLNERKKREEDKLKRLLDQRRIGLEEFQKKVLDISDYIENEKDSIEKARRDIEKGLRVATQIARKTQKDAHWLCRNIGLSKSSEQLKVAPKLLIQFSPSDYFLEIDELSKRARQRNNNFFGNGSDGYSSDNTFTEQELKGFKSPKNIDIEFNNMNKNIMIEEFLRTQKA